MAAFDTVSTLCRTADQAAPRPVPADAGAEELKLLWEAGVICAVVDTEGLAPEKFHALRKTIDDTKFPPRGRRRDKIDATLPRPAPEPAIADHEEEEEE